MLSHFAKYRSLMPSLALLVHLIDGVDGGTTGPVSRAAAARAIACARFPSSYRYSRATFLPSM